MNLIVISEFWYIPQRVEGELCTVVNQRDMFEIPIPQVSLTQDTKRRMECITAKIQQK